MEAALHAGSLLAAGLLQPLSENSRPGHQLSTLALYPGIGFINSNTATGLRVCLYDDGRGSRDTGKERILNLGSIILNHDASAVGRYTGPDEPFADRRSLDPQSWNNPLKYVDSTGKAIELAGDDDQRMKQLQALKAAAGKKAGAYLHDNAEKDKDGNQTGRHFVGILGGGPSGKGPDFGSINSVAKDMGNAGTSHPFLSS